MTKILRFYFRCGKQLYAASAGIFNSRRLGRSDKQLVDRWLAKEDTQLVQPGHASAVHLVRDSFGFAEKL